MEPYRLMTIFAHPDDETFGCAGAMYRAVNDGAAVAIISATRGEEGEIADPMLATSANLGQVREQELRAAGAAIGVTDVAFLDYIDGHLAEADHTVAVGRVVWQIRRFRPDIVVTFNANGMYGHPDHMAIHHIVLDAIPAAADPTAYPGLPPHRVTKVYYSAVPRDMLLQMRDQLRAQGEDFVPGGNAATIPVEEMGDPANAITTVIKLTPEEFQHKVRAALAHRTQIAPDNPILRDRDDPAHSWLNTEQFILAPAPYSQGDFAVPEDALAAGLPGHTPVTVMPVHE